MQSSLLHQVLTISLQVEGALSPAHYLEGALGVNSVLGGIFLGGSFKGEKIQGAVLPGGASFFVYRGDGVAQLNNRCRLLTEDNNIVGVLSKGVLYLDEIGRQQLNKGQWPIKKERYRSTCSLHFQVLTGPYVWLQERAFISDIEYLYSDQILMRVYELG